jgi:phospholipase/carboxylesterase
MPEPLPSIEVISGSPVANAVIWLHGLGADGHDFEPIVPALGLQDLGVRFVLPHAPRRPITVNMGLIMRAWFDIRGLDFEGNVDEKGIAESVDQVEALVAREKERGIDSRRIVLAGFSQGGAIALHVALRHPEPLGGVVALSTYLPPWPGGRAGTAGRLSAGKPETVAGTPLPAVFQAHGTDDPLITPERGEETRERLRALGCTVTWKTYPMEHAVCLEEIADISAWMRSRLGMPSPA